MIRALTPEQCARMKHKACALQQATLIRGDCTKGQERHTLAAKSSQQRGGRRGVEQDKTRSASAPLLIQSHGRLGPHLQAHG